MHFYNFKKTKKDFLGKKYTFYIADTPQKISKGFANTNHPGKKTGIIFIFPNEEIRYFTTKDMKFDLKIYFYDKNWNLVSQKIAKAGIKRISSEKPAMYVIEIPI